MKLGFFVYRTNMALPWDLVAERGGVYYKVQCKYRTAYNGTLTIKNRHWVANKQRQYTQDDIDILAIYCPDSDQVYLMRAEEFVDRRQVTLRLYEARNNQKKDICLAKDYIHPSWVMRLP